jgi:hypothetical protein
MPPAAGVSFPQSVGERSGDRQVYPAQSLAAQSLLRSVHVIPALAGPLVQVDAPARYDPSDVRIPASESPGHLQPLESRISPVPEGHTGGRRRRVPVSSIINAVPAAAPRMGAAIAIQKNASRDSPV